MEAIVFSGNDNKKKLKVEIPETISTSPRNSTPVTGNASSTPTGQQSTKAPPAKRPRGRPPLSGRKSQGRHSTGSDKDLTESPRAPSPLPHIPKNKIGPAVREATQKLLARLLTEDPITLLSLHETVSELSLEQVQDILDVLVVIGFVITVRPKRKRGRTTDVSSTATITNSSLSSPTSKSANDSSARSRASEGSNEVLYTITGFARGPSPPADLWNIFTDIERIQKSANEAKKRADALEELIAKLPPQSLHAEEDINSEENVQQNAATMLMDHMQSYGVESDPIYDALANAIGSRRAI